MQDAASVAWVLGPAVVAAAQLGVAVPLRLAVAPHVLPEPPPFRPSEGRALPRAELLRAPHLALRLLLLPLGVPPQPFLPVAELVVATVAGGPVRLAVRLPPPLLLP